MPQAIDFTEHYANGDTPWDSGQPSEELVRVLDAGKLTGHSVLELGCGTGTNALELARRGFQVTAVDCVKQAIDLAVKKAEAAGVKVNFRVADVLNDALGGPYDALFDRGLYHCVRTAGPGAFLRALEKVTRPGSTFLCLAGNVKEKLADGPPVVSEPEIRADFGSLFELVELREFRFSTSRPDLRPLAWSILLRRK